MPKLNKGGQAMTIRILIADEQPLMRLGLRTLLKDHPEMDVVGEAEDWCQLIRMVERSALNLIILDLQILGLNPMGKITQFQALADHSRLLLFTASTDASLIMRLVATGANGYVVKSEPPLLVIEAIQAVIDGEPWFSNGISGMVARFLSDGCLRQKEPTLNERELEVLTLMMKGDKYEDIERNCTYPKELSVMMLKGSSANCVFKIRLKPLLLHLRKVG
jgi:DNA-binding NarL/FixJ family response regulator